MKIVLAVDGSDYSRRMLAWLAAHPALLGGQKELTLLTVTPELPPHVRRYLSEDQLRQYPLDEAEKVFAPLREFARQQGWTLREHRALGQAATRIAEFVGAERADLLVMGSHGHGAFAGAVLGSVTTRVMAHSQVPVLVIR